MHALTYEWRRLVGVRSTWLIILATLAVQTALDAVTLHHSLVGAGAPVQALTAAVPMLPLPVAALGAGAAGALSLGQELRHPALRPLVPTRLRRLRVLLAKLLVNAACALLLVTVTLGAGLLLLRFGRPDGAALTVGLVHGSAPLALAGYLALVLVGGWTGLLAAGLCRSAAAGMLVLVTLPLLAQPLTSAALAALDRARHLHGLAARLGGLRDSGELSPALLAAVVAAAVVVLFAAYAGLLLRRREL